MKVKKKFQYRGLELRIVEREEDYMNSPDKVTVRRVIAPNGGIIPVQIQRRQPLKSIAEQAIIVLDDFEQRGADVVAELTRELSQ